MSAPGHLWLLLCGCHLVTPVRFIKGNRTPLTHTIPIKLPTRPTKKHSQLNENVEFLINENIAGDLAWLSRMDKTRRRKLVACESQSMTQSLAHYRARSLEFMARKTKTKTKKTNKQKTNKTIVRCEPRVMTRLHYLRVSTRLLRTSGALC